MEQMTRPMSFEDWWMEIGQYHSINKMGCKFIWDSAQDSAMLANHPEIRAIRKYQAEKAQERAAQDKPGNGVQQAAGQNPLPAYSGPPPSGGLRPNCTA